MRRGKKINIRLEIKSTGGVITAELLRATVLYDSGANITVQGEDGVIYAVDFNQRDEDGAFVVVI